MLQNRIPFVLDIRKLKLFSNSEFPKVVSMSFTQEDPGMHIWAWGGMLAVGNKLMTSVNESMILFYPN